MWGGVGVGSFVFVCEGWVVCRVFLPFPALSRPLLGFRPRSCWLTLFRWRRPLAVLFSIPGRWWRVAPSVLFFLHIFLLLRSFSDGMYSAALHTLLCLRRLVRVSIVWAYLSLPMRACGGGRVLSATPLRLTLLARLSLCFSLLCGVAWHVTYLYLCRRTGALGGGLCGLLGAYILLRLRQHVCAYAGGLPFAPYVSVRAEMGMFSRLHLLVTFVGVVIVVLFSFECCVVARHVTYLCSAASGVVVACLFLVFCFCVCSTFLWLFVAPSLRSSYQSFTLLAPSYHVAFPR